MIQVKNLKKNFGDLEVLKNINLTVQEGEKLVIIGPSGSGKSTLIRCMNYLEEPTAGEDVYKRQALAFYFWRSRRLIHTVDTINGLLEQDVYKRQVISSVLKTACTRLPLARAVLKLSSWMYPGIFQRELVSICRFRATEPRM